MNCLEIQEKIVDLISGELTAEERMIIQEHIDHCPSCAEDYDFISHCVHCWGPVEAERFTSDYWEEFVISVHEKICHCKPIKPFPYKVVIPIAASLLGAASVCYILFFRSAPKEIVKPLPSGNDYDPYEEVYELSPEEQKEFIRIINQKYSD